MRPRHARRRDANEPELVKALRKRGASVTLLDGAGVPDLLVGYQGTTWLVEVKLPLGPKGGTSQRRGSEGGSGDFTADQVAWWSEWLGASPIVVRTLEDVDKLIASAGDVAKLERDRYSIEPNDDSPEYRRGWNDHAGHVARIVRSDTAAAMGRAS